MRDLVIFDCDGTLVDTLYDVGLCFNEALARHGFPSYPLEEYGGFVGGNLEQIVSGLLPDDARAPENITAVKETYRELYRASPKPHTLPYEGIPQLLEELRGRGCILAVNTNKGQALADALLEKLFPDHPFEVIVGYEESRPSKPDAFGVRMICDAVGAGIERAVYVGDGESDRLTALNAQVPFVLVSWGQGDDSLRDAEGVAAVAEQPSSVAAVVSGLR